MTEAALTCGMWRGITTPMGWAPPTVPSDMVGKAEAKRSDAKGFTKYCAIIAAVLELSADGLVRDGKVVKEADLVVNILDGIKEAAEAANALRKQAEQVKAEALARAQRMEKLEADIKEAQAKGGITYEQMLAWANVARESGAYLTMHGGTDQGSGISIRFTQAAQVATAPRAPREAGGGNKGGTETRSSAYAEVMRERKKMGASCPHNIFRDGNKADGWTYRDGLNILTEPLSKYLQRVYPTCQAAVTLRGYDDRRKAAKLSA